MCAIAPCANGTLPCTGYCVRGAFRRGTSSTHFKNLSCVTSNHVCPCRDRDKGPTRSVMTCSHGRVTTEFVAYALQVSAAIPCAPDTFSIPHIRGYFAEHPGPVIFGYNSRDSLCNSAIFR